MKYNDKRTLTIRIIAIVMAALLLLSIFTMLFHTVFATDELYEIAATGGTTAKWPIIAAVGAVAVIAACVILPKLGKNKKD